MTDMDKLTIERMATVRAHRDIGEELETAAEHAGITVDAWQEAEPRLLAELDEDFTMGRTERLELYDREYQRVRAELTGVAAQIAPARSDDAAQAIPSASPVVQAAQAPALSEATYQKLAAAPRAPAAPVAPPPDAAPVSIRSAPPNNLAATAEVNLSHIIAALPFQGDASKAASAPPRSPQRRGPPVSTGTVEADPKAAFGAATPFEDAKSPGPAAAPAPADAPAVSRRGPPALAATAEVDFKAFRSVVTPFQGATPPAAPPIPSAQRRGPAIPTGTVMSDEKAPFSSATPFASQAHPVHSGTVMSDASAPLSRAVPFAQPSGEPALSVEQYAQLTAMLTKGANADATFKRFGMNAFQYSHLVSTYSKKFAHDPTLKIRFDQLTEEALRRA